MEEEGPINFKALRAKFQEEALLAQSKSRPAVAEKPKHLPPPVGHCSSVVSSVNSAVENKAPVVTQVILRDGLQASGAKRPISFPPQPQQIPPSSQFANRDGSTKQSLRDRHMPLVLPVLPVKEQKTELLARKEHKLVRAPGKEVKPQTKIKKKGLLLPFTHAKASKVSVANRREPTYAELTTRPSSAPGELPSMEKKNTEDGLSFQGDQSTAELRLSSPDVPNTPPSTDMSFESNNKVVNTLERAKKKFSCRQMLIAAKHKSLRSPDYASRGKALPSPPKNIETVEPRPPIPPPVCPPHLAYVSARPFFKAKTSSRKVAFDKQFWKDKADIPSGERHPPPAPPKRRLPDVRLLGSVPPKPPRPASVDLSGYHLPDVKEVAPGSSQALSEEPEPAHTSSVLDAPDFPDFEISEIETAESEVVDIGALDMEALDFVSSDLPAPDDCGGTDFEDLPLDLSAYGPLDPLEPFICTTIRDLNLGDQYTKPHDPSGFPEPINLPEFPETTAPEQWSRNKNTSTDPMADSHAAVSDWVAGKPAAQEREDDNPTALDEESQPHPSGHELNGCSESCDNVYEEVEDMNRFILGQISHKHQEGQKNPYAHNLPMKEEASLNIWPQNPWGNASEEHAHSSHTHVLSKDHQSPNAADHKEQRKREKQRLEKEKKEQKEREKKENEMKKKFKVTGKEEPMYHAKVMVASKVRKNDLPVRSGETVSIIRTTSCPKGKWLARDSNHKYGYISVMNVELNIKEMLELGKKAQAAGRGGNVEGDTISIGSRSSSHPVLTSSFTDDSEEWAFEDEANECPSFPQPTDSVPEMTCGHAGAQHTLSDANLEDLHTQHEALQKLAIFFQHGKSGSDDIADGAAAAAPSNAEPPNLCSVEEPPYPEQEVDFTELELLPPPPLYADTL